MKISGKFVVNIVPTTYSHEVKDSVKISRLTIDKTFEGDLEAHSLGEMLSVLDSDQTSGGYVAVEQVNGVLKGKKGSFVLQHSGTMSKEGDYGLQLAVVPNSGCGELVGLSGTMKIDKKDGDHFYEFDFELPSL